LCRPDISGRAGDRIAQNRKAGADAVVLLVHAVDGR
jgi:hypothetical protein